MSQYLLYAFLVYSHYINDVMYIPVSAESCLGLLLVFYKINNCNYIYSLCLFISST